MLKGTFEGIEAYLVDLVITLKRRQIVLVDFLNCFLTTVAAFGVVIQLRFETFGDNFQSLPADNSRFGWVVVSAQVTDLFPGILYEPLLLVVVWHDSDSIKSVVALDEDTGNGLDVFLAHRTFDSESVCHQIENSKTDFVEDMLFVGFAV